MADDFSIDTPSADRGHEAIRVAVLAAIADLSQNIADVGDSFSLTDALFGLVDSLLTVTNDLTARVTALETPPAP